VPVGVALAFPLLLAARYADVLIPGVPHVQQKPDFCGEAAAEMWLHKLGLRMDQNAVFDCSGVDPLAGRGVWTRELKVALELLGFQVGPVWFQVPADRAPAALEASFRALHADLERGVPSIVCMHYDESEGAPEHFRLILGYDAHSDEVIYHEPAQAGGAYRHMKRDRFLRLWPLKYQPAEWTLVRLRLAAGADGIKPPPHPAGFSSADYAQHIMQLKKRVPPGFTIVIEPPFVVIGDEPPASVRARAQHTVRWAVDHLKQDFFTREPAEILDIWLFRNAGSYESHSRTLFGETPSTPYGYYSETQKALIMNIETGGGTLVHEIVHPLMDANFPERPAWLNEGLGSLYEQSGEVSGHIHGFPNWRLPDLQRAIRARTLPPLRSLLLASESGFYRDPAGTNYGAARYVLYYLQQRGLLVPFYRRFRASHRVDPGGVATLLAVSGQRDLESFQRQWEAFVLSLAWRP